MNCDSLLVVQLQHAHDMAFLIVFAALVAVVVVSVTALYHLRHK